MDSKREHLREINHEIVKRVTTVSKYWDQITIDISREAMTGYHENLLVQPRSQNGFNLFEHPRPILHGCYN